MYKCKNRIKTRIPRKRCLGFEAGEQIGWSKRQSGRLMLRERGAEVGKSLKKACNPMYGKEDAVKAPALVAGRKSYGKKPVMFDGNQSVGGS